MKVTYERDLNRTWLVLEEEQVYQEDYQMKMIKANALHYFIPVLWQGKDENSCFRYDVTGKLSLKSYFERTKMTYPEIESFVRQLGEAMQEAGNYLLEPDRILVRPELVFWEKGQFWFCYYPLQEEPVWKEFHGLTEYFVREVDYADKEGVCLVSELHKASMEENYSIWKTLEKIQEEREESLTAIREGEEATGWDGGQPEYGMVVRETPDEADDPEGKGFFSRLHFRKKRKRWGDWEGLEL